jgi:hypothetical protein
VLVKLLGTIFPEPPVFTDQHFIAIAVELHRLGAYPCGAVTGVIQYGDDILDISAGEQAGFSTPKGELQSRKFRIKALVKNQAQYHSQGVSGTEVGSEIAEEQQ